MLLASSDAIRSMILSSSHKEKVEQKLMSIPSADRERWHLGDSVHTWTCNAAELTTNTVS